MAQYRSPGVYVEEVDAGPRPIQGVSTSIAGTVGVTERGPSRGKPVLVTSYGQFRRIFGGPLSDPSADVQNQWALDQAEGGRWWQFALAVNGFFDNGGEQLYVKRVVSHTAQAASGMLGQGVISELAHDADAAATTLRLRHLLGIEVGTQVNVYASGRAVPGNPFTVTAYNATGEVTLNNAVGQELEAGRDFLEILMGAPPQGRTDAAPAAGQPDPRMTVRAKATGDWGGGVTPGTGVNVRLRPMVGATLHVMGDPALGGAPPRTQLSADADAGANQISVDDIAGFAAAPAAVGLFDTVVIRGMQYEITAVGRAAPGPGTLDLNAPVPAGGWTTRTPVAGLRPANTAGAADTLRVSGASQLYRNALVELDNTTAKERLHVRSVDGNSVRFTGNVTNAHHEGHPLRVIEAEVNVRYHRDGVLEAEETFTNLRLAEDDGFSDVVRHVNTRSELIDVERGAGYPATGPGELDEFPSVPPAAAGAAQLQWMDLANGADNLNDLSVDDFVGVDGGSGHRTGIQALEDIDDISIVLAPGMWSGTIRDALLRHCDAMRYRFGVLDPPDDLDIQEIRAFRAPIDTRFAALYYPWIVVRNAARQRFDRIGPSAHITGIYARVDALRGFHKAPANEIIRGIRQPDPVTRRMGIAQEITKREQDLLNPEGINALRYFPGRGQRVWGARTLSSNSNWRYINVRRIFTFVERSIDEGTNWVVFEPNDNTLWARVRQTVSNFLNTQWRNGVLEGETPEEAYFVACDRGVTMTQDDIENGRLICEVGIAPVFPAEFVIFRIQKYTAESKLA